MLARWVHPPSWWPASQTPSCFTRRWRRQVGREGGEGRQGCGPWVCACVQVSRGGRNAPAPALHPKPRVWDHGDKLEKGHLSWFGGAGTVKCAGGSGQTGADSKAHRADLGTRCPVPAMPGSGSLSARLVLVAERRRAAWPGTNNLPVARRRRAPGRRHRVGAGGREEGGARRRPPSRGLLTLPGNHGGAAWATPADCSPP